MSRPAGRHREPPGVREAAPPACAVFVLAVLLPVAAARAQAAPRAAAALVPETLRRVALLGDPSFRHAGSITHVIPLADGKRVLTTARDASARLWDLTRGTELRRYSHPDGNSVWHAVLLPGGRGLLAGGDKGVARWDLDARRPETPGSKTAAPLRTFSRKGSETVFRLAVDKAGGRFVAAGDNKLAILLDLKTGREVQHFAGHKESVYSVLFSKDAKQLITGSGDGTIRFWLVATGKELRQVKNATGSVYTMVFNPGQTGILVCCEKKSVWLMDAASGKETWQAKLPKGVYCGAWSGDGARVAAMCQDDRLYVLDAATGKTQWSAKLPGETNYGVAFSRDSSEVLCGSGCLLCRFDAKTGARVYPRPDARAQTAPGAAVAPVPAPGAVLRVDDAPGLCVLDARTGATRAVWLAQESIGAVAVSGDSSKVLAGGTDKTTWLLDARSGKLLHRLPHGGGRGVAFSPDGKLAIAAGSAANSGQGVAVWRVEDGKAVAGLPCRRRPNAVSVDPQGRPVIAVCGRESLQIWGLRAGKLLREIPLKDRKPSGCAFVPAAAPCLLIRDKAGLSLWTSPRAEGVRLTDAEIRRLIAELGADKYKTRQRATERLIQAGDRVLAALAKVENKDAEVQTRVAHIQETILNSGSAYEQKAQVLLAEGDSSFSLHPDGRHWAALEGSYATARIVIGRIDAGKLTVVRRIQDANVPETVVFGRGGRLYVGSGNGTVSVYASRR